MAVQTGSGVVVAIGTTQAAEDQSDYESDSYTTIGEVAESGEFGDTRQIVPWISLADGRTRKARGSSDAGDWPLTVGFDGNDAGQAALKAAFAVVSQSADEFNFRVQLNDSEGVSPTTFYFRGKVTSRPVQGITPDNIVTMSFTVAINTAILEVAAA